ncbi:MAG: hypothetical protein ABI467_03550 [Kofleriaceae bacterium]
MKLPALCTLAALAMTGACTDTTTVSGSWRDGQSVAGACHTGLFTSTAHVEIFDPGHLVASDSFDCAELGFSLEIPVDVTHVRVTAADPWGGSYDEEFVITDRFLDVGLISFAQDTQPD